MAPAPDLGAATENAFYPLQLGNEWHYDRNMVLEFFPEGGTGSSGTEEFQFEETRVLDQTEELFGRTYIVESRTIVEVSPESDVTHEWVRYRQDPSGLYEADVSINDPPGPAKATLPADGAQEPGVRIAADPSAFGAAASAYPASFRNALAELERRRLVIRGALRGQRVSAPAGPVLSEALSNEITRLSYPLHVGASFAIREGLLDAHVEAQEPLVTPAGKLPAWRIRYAWGFAGFDDTILVWFGRCGNLKLYFKGQVDVVAPDGTVLGTMHIEDVEVVDELDVQGRPCGTRPGRPLLDG